MLFMSKTLQFDKFLKKLFRDFLGGPLVKGLPWKGGDMSLIPGWGTKIPLVAACTPQLLSLECNSQPDPAK